MPNKKTFVVRKFHTIKCSVTHTEIVQETFMVNNHSEVQEYDDEDTIDKVVEMLNSNSDDNCRYTKITIKG